MNDFRGFPSNPRSTVIPNLFFSDLLPQTNEVSEIKTALSVFWLISQKRGSPRFTTREEMLSINMFPDLSQQDAEAALDTGLKAASDRGILLTTIVESNSKDKKTITLYFISNPEGKRDQARIRTGTMTEFNAPKREQPGSIVPERIFDLYEQSIGLVDSPIIADLLKDAENRYPAIWIEDAFREAIRHNRRRWAYVEAILRRWKEEGREEDGTNREHSRQAIQRYFSGTRPGRRT